MISVLSILYVLFLESQGILASLFTCEVLVVAACELFLSGGSKSVAKADFKNESSLAGNVEVIRVGDFKITSEFLLRVELEFGNFAVLFGQFKGNFEVRPEDFFFGIFVSKLVLKEFHVADTVFVPFVFPERVVVVDTPLRPQSIKL